MAQQEKSLPASWGVSKRLDHVIEGFHNHPGCLQKWHVDEERKKALQNFLTGTCEAARAVLQSHLHSCKWAQCAFTSLLLKSSRWLLGASNKSGWRKDILTMDEAKQTLFVEVHVRMFMEKSRKLRASAKSKARASLQEWDQLADFCCIMVEAAEEAKKLGKLEAEAAIYAAARNRLAAGK